LGASSYSWSNGGTGSSISITPTVTSIYSIQGTYAGSACKGTNAVTVTVSPCTTVSETLLHSHFNVYPNPANDFLIIESLYSTEVYLFDVTGNLVLQLEITEATTKIDLKEFRTGFYFLRNEKNPGYNHKFVKTD
jgi:hypothetical protein